jgi:hypothetical protein
MVLLKCGVTGIVLDACRAELTSWGCLLGSAEIAYHLSLSVAVGDERRSINVARRDENDFLSRLPATARRANDFGLDRSTGQNE